MVRLQEVAAEGIIVIGGRRREPWEGEPSRGLLPWRVLAIVLAVVIGPVTIVVGVVYSVFIESGLSVTVVEVENFSAGSTVSVRVSSDANTAHYFPVKGPQIVVVDGSVLVEADPSSGAVEVRWVRVSMADVDPRFERFAADVVVSTLKPRSKMCLFPTRDQRLVLSLLLGADVFSDRTTVCAENAGGRNVTKDPLVVALDRVRPSDEDEIDVTDVIDLDDVADPPEVVALVNGLLPPPG